MTTTTRRRIPFVAALLSLLAPGVGQIYNGQGGPGIVLFALTAALPFLGGWAGWPRRFGGLVALILAEFAIWLFAIIHAFVRARRTGEAGLKKYQKTAVYALLIVVSFGMLLLPPRIWRAALGLSPYRIASSSMMPALQEGDYLMTDPKAYDGRKPQRGDLVIFEHRRDPSRLFLDRVIALEGETIEIRDKQVFLDGRPLHEPYKVHQDSGLDPGRDGFGPFTVPAGHCFVLGDNRDRSNDGRYWGALPLANLKGRALYIYWSKDTRRIGPLGGD